MNIRQSKQKSTLANAAAALLMAQDKTLLLLPAPDPIAWPFDLGDSEAYPCIYTHKDLKALCGDGHEKNAA